MVRQARLPALEFTCRFRWESGSLAFWDNRCTQHFAVNDYPAETRIMRRIAVCGDTRSEQKSAKRKWEG